MTVHSNCKHPDFVKVGPHEIYVKGFRDFVHHDYEAISKLDVFIGMTISFDKYETTAPQSYKNPLLNEIARGWANLKADSVPDNIIVLDVPDYGIDEDIVTVCLALLAKKKRIGFGCYGAHGRTGWLLARLIKHFEGLDGDAAVRAVRARFCQDCIESDSQIKNLGCKTETFHSTWGKGETKYPGLYKDDRSFTGAITGGGEISTAAHESRYNPVHDVRFQPDLYLKDYYEKLEQEQEDRTPRISDDIPIKYYDD